MLRDPINVNDLEQRTLRLLTFKVLRATNYLNDLSLASVGHTNLGKIGCRDGVPFMTESEWLQHLHSEQARELCVFPYAEWGGAMRFSDFCPEMPEDRLGGIPAMPNSIVRLVNLNAYRIGVFMRDLTLIKAGGHGLFCGWASKLGLGLFQHTRLTIDGRNVIKATSIHESWVASGTLEVFPTYHMDCRCDGTPQPRTYLLDQNHNLVTRFPMQQVMAELDDRRFLELVAPSLLKEHGLAFA